MKKVLVWCVATGMVLGLVLTEARSEEATSASSAAARNRLVRVVTVSEDGLSAKPGPALLEAALARLEEAASFEPDIACLPEAFARGEAETSSGATAERVGQWARKHRSYVICPLHLREGDKVYNSALLIDRTGAVVGRYHKIRPTEGELKAGISPGPKDPPVFQTDFGTIGIQICFDVNWHDQWQCLKEKGAEIVFSLPRILPPDSLPRTPGDISISSSARPVRGRRASST